MNSTMNVTGLFRIEPRQASQENEFNSRVQGRKEKPRTARAVRGLRFDRSDQ